MESTMNLEQNSTKKIKLDFKERDEWRGIAQLKKRESKYFKKLRKQAGEKDERHTTRIG